MIAYKQFRVDSDGYLYPLFVNTNCGYRVGGEYDAYPGNYAKDGKHVKSKLGALAYRPGFHCCSIPFADHIGRRIDGKLMQKYDTVWCEVELVGNEIDTGGRAITNMVPMGWYRFRTNTNANRNVDWYIGGVMRILRILSQDEVKLICREHNIEAQPVEPVFYVLDNGVWLTYPQVEREKVIAQYNRKSHRTHIDSVKEKYLHIVYDLFAGKTECTDIYEFGEVK